MKKHAMAILGILTLPLATILPATSARAGTSSTSVGANILLNGGFERGADPGSHLAITPGSPSLTGWTAIGSEVSVYGTYWQAEEGTRSLALANPTASSNSASGVKQTVATMVGQRYQVTFYQSGNPNDHQPSILRLQVGSQTHDFTYQAAATASTSKMDWIERIYVFSATTTTTNITFYALYTPDNDPLGLDNVQIRTIQLTAGSGSTPAPKPGIKLSASALKAGGSENIAVMAAPRAPIALVIDAPDNSQVVTPAHADATGHYTFTWNVPANLNGTVHVLVDSAGAIAQASFTVS